MKWITERLPNGMLFTHMDYSKIKMDEDGGLSMDSLYHQIYLDFMFGPKDPGDIVPWNFYALPLPPLKYFFGWTPMKEWISRCRPFVPTRYLKPAIEYIPMNLPDKLSNYLQSPSLLDDLLNYGKSLSECAKFYKARHIYRKCLEMNKVKIAQAIYHKYNLGGESHLRSDAAIAFGWSMLAIKKLNAE